MQPYYQDEHVTIYHGDCLSVLPSLDKVAVVLTDPPYGVRKASWDRYLPTDWMHVACELADVIAVMPGTSNLLRLPERVGRLFYRWTLAVHLVNGMTHGCMGYGNWFPCVVYAEPEADLHQRASDIKGIAVGGDYKPNHPSPKPLAAMNWLVSRMPDGDILDPFMGSGTTLRAAKDMGRKAIGIEIREDYCEMAANRMRQKVRHAESYSRKAIRK